MSRKPFAPTTAEEFERILAEQKDMLCQSYEEQLAELQEEHDKRLNVFRNQEHAAEDKETLIDSVTEGKPRPSLESHDPVEARLARNLVRFTVKDKKRAARIIEYQDDRDAIAAAIGGK